MYLNKVLFFLAKSEKCENASGAISVFPLSNQFISPLVEVSYYLYNYYPFPIKYIKLIYELLILFILGIVASRKRSPYHQVIPFL